MAAAALLSPANAALPPLAPPPNAPGDAWAWAAAVSPTPLALPALPTDAAAGPLLRALREDPLAADQAATVAALRLVASVDVPSRALVEAAALAGLAPAPLPRDPAAARDLASALARLRASAEPAGASSAADVARLPPDLAAALAPAVDGVALARALAAEALRGLAPEQAQELLGFAREAGFPDRPGAPPLAGPGPAGSEVTVAFPASSASDPSRLAALRTLLRHVDLPGLLAAGVAAARGLEASALLLASVKVPAAADARDALFEDPALGVLVAGAGSSVFTEDATLIVDLGGDDLYANPAGGAFGAPSGWGGGPTGRRAVSAVLDLAGNDRYVRADLDAVQGGAVLGVGMLFDLAGDDTYVAGQEYPVWTTFNQGGAGPAGVAVLFDKEGADTMWSSGFGQGSGAFGGVGLLLDGDGGARLGGSLGMGNARAFGVGALVAGGTGPDVRGACCMAMGRADSGGVGVLVDAGGDDQYLAGWWSQGSATFGDAVGLLVDLGGADLYQASEASQGHGDGGSAGVLADLGGAADRYAAWWGQGEGVTNSLGLLADDGGADEYDALYFGQGIGLTAGVGALLDGGGDDRYASWYFAQGVGWGGGAGLLLDADGRDRYALPGYDGWAFGQGTGAWPGSAGLLADGSGDDVYDAGRTAQGFGSGGGVGLLLERGGNDRYAGLLGAPARGAGVAGGAGVFWDASGNDIYGGAPGGDDRVWTEGLGVGLDGVPFPE